MVEWNDFSEWTTGGSFTRTANPPQKLWTASSVLVMSKTGDRVQATVAPGWAVRMGVTHAGGSAPGLVGGENDIADAFDVCNRSDDVILSTLNTTTDPGTSHYNVQFWLRAGDAFDFQTDSPSSLHLCGEAAAWDWSYKIPTVFKVGIVEATQLTATEIAVREQAKADAQIAAFEAEAAATGAAYDAWTATQTPYTPEPTLVYSAEQVNNNGDVVMTYEVLQMPPHGTEYFDYDTLTGSGTYDTPGWIRVYVEDNFGRRQEVGEYSTVDEAIAKVDADTGSSSGSVITDDYTPQPGVITGMPAGGFWPDSNGDTRKRTDLFSDASWIWLLFPVVLLAALKILSAYSVTDSGSVL